MKIKAIKLITSTVFLAVLASAFPIPQEKEVETNTNIPIISAEPVYTINTINTINQNINNNDDNVKAIDNDNLNYKRKLYREQQIDAKENSHKKIKKSIGKRPKVTDIDLDEGSTENKK